LPLWLHLAECRNTPLYASFQRFRACSRKRQEHGHTIRLILLQCGTLASPLTARHHAQPEQADGGGAMRKFLVVLDDTRECLNAIRFAALRAAHTGGGVQILSIIPPEEFQHWIGVGDLMRDEARERIEAHFEVFAKWMRDKHAIEPELVIREGQAVDQILAQIREDQHIGVLVLGAGDDKSGPGPLVTQLSRASGSLPVPITIVPGDLPKERLEQIT